MRKRMAVVAALAAFLSLPAAAQTADQVIAKSVAARGGLEKIKAIQSVRMAGRVTVGPGIEAPFTLEIKRPMQMRLDIVVQGITATVQAFDGKSGWQLVPFGGQKSAQPLTADELKDAEESADLDGPLVDYKAKGHSVELVGKEDVEGANCYKLKVTLKNGDVVYDYIDTDSNLEIKQESKRTINGTERETEETIGDYKDVNGVLFPFAIEAGIKGSPQRQKIIVEKVDLNVPLDGNRFAMPAPTETKPPESKPPVAAVR
jgi:outer membrane lipoprotein-sorting protein